MIAREKDLESLLIVAERELNFLIDNLQEFPEIANTPGGALLLACLEGGATMADRLRIVHLLTSPSEAI